MKVLILWKHLKKEYDRNINLTTIADIQVHKE